MRPQLFPLIRPFLSRAFLLTRALTFGVRGAVLDAEDRVLLVKHGYVGGWHMPGGGVEVGETAVEALGRELSEEGNITLTGQPVLHGLYHHPGFSPRDHVALYVVRAFTWSGPPQPNREITDCAFFPARALPEDTTPATRRRLAEILDGEPAAPRW